MRLAAAALCAFLCSNVADAERATAPAHADLLAQLASRPDDTDARYALATAYLRNGDPEAAKAEFDNLLRRDAANPDWLLGCAQSLIALGKPLEAVALLERARASAPSYEDLWRVELTALESSHQRERAQALLDEAARQFPNADWPRVRRAELREEELLRAGTRMSLGSSYERLSESRGEWRALTVDFDHPLRRGLNILLGLHGEERFGNRDGQVAAGFVARLDSGWAAAFTADVSPGASVLPEGSAQIEVGRPIASHTSLGVRARHARHQSVDVNVLAATAESGYGSFRFAYSLAATRPSGLGTSFGHSVRISRDYGIGSHVSLVLAHGEEAETVAPGQVLVTRVNAIALAGIHWQSAAWGAAWELGYHEQGDLYNRMRFRLGLERRF